MHDCSYRVEVTIFSPLDNVLEYQGFRNPRDRMGDKMRQERHRGAPISTYAQPNNILISLSLRTSSTWGLCLRPIFQPWSLCAKEDGRILCAILA